MSNLIPAFGSGLHTLLAFIVALSVIVAVHEFGHYIVGRWSGIRAEVFSLGFGPRLVSRRDRRGTLWQIAAIPLGGYVRFLGDADAASTHGVAVDPARTRQTLAGAPLWARAATVAAARPLSSSSSLGDGVAARRTASRTASTRPPESSSTSSSRKSTLASVEKMSVSHVLMGCSLGVWRGSGCGRSGAVRPTMTTYNH